MISFLLSGCFSGKESLSSQLDRDGLRQTEENRRMAELKKTRTIRLGVTEHSPNGAAEYRKKLESKGWRVREIICPDDRMTGLLRSGMVDLIFLPGATQKDAARMDLQFLAPSLLSGSRLLIQEISGL